MTEWGVRLTAPGQDADEFRIPAGKAGAEDYAAAVNGSALSLMLREKATVVTRAAAGDPWEVPGA